MASFRDPAGEIEAILKQHEVEKWHLCTACGSQFPCREKLLEHIAYHCFSEGKECTITKAIITSRSSIDSSIPISKKLILVSHDWKIRKASDSGNPWASSRDNSKWFSCKDCGKRYKQKLQLSIHDFCHRSFGKGCRGARPTPLIPSHSVTVPATQQAKADLSGASVLSETSSKRFACDECGKKFVTRRYCENEHKAYCRKRGGIKTVGVSRLSGSGLGAAKEEPEALRNQERSTGFVSKIGRSGVAIPSRKARNVREEPKPKPNQNHRDSSCTCIMCDATLSSSSKAPQDSNLSTENPDASGELEPQPSGSGASSSSVRRPRKRRSDFMLARLL